MKSIRQALARSTATGAAAALLLTLGAASVAPSAQAAPTAFGEPCSASDYQPGTPGTPKLGDDQVFVVAGTQGSLAYMDRNDETRGANIDFCAMDPFPEAGGKVALHPGGTFARNGVHINISDNPPPGVYPLRYYARDVNTGLVGSAVLTVTVGQALVPEIERLDEHRFRLTGRGDVQMAFYYRYRPGPGGAGGLYDIKPGEVKILSTSARRMGWTSEWQQSLGLAHDLYAPRHDGVLQMRASKKAEAQAEKAATKKAKADAKKKAKKKAKAKKKKKR